MPNPNERFYINRLVEAMEAEGGMTNKNVEKFQIQVNKYRKEMEGLSDRELEDWNPVDGMYKLDGKTAKAIKWWKEYDKDESEKEAWEEVGKAKAEFESITWDKRL